MDYIDQTHNKITLDRHPTRIISLVPSQTELLYYLGIKPLAQTIFCVHPYPEFKAANKIGGTKKLDIAKIIRLNPDLIIGNKEENAKEDIEELRRHFPVWLSDIYTLADAYKMINQIGTLVDKDNDAQLLVRQIEASFNSLDTKSKQTVLYLIWKNPYMAAGRNTFINSVLEKAGYINILNAAGSRYPEIGIDEILALNPQSILLSSEPFPFKEKHIAELQNLLPTSNIHLVNGELYSWYGPRLLKTAAHLSKKSSL